MKQSIAKRLDAVDSRIKPKTHHTPSIADAREVGRWIVNTIEKTCGPCPLEIQVDTGVIIDNQLKCNRGHSPFWCKRFFDDILARAEVEKDKAEKEELLKFHAWGSRGVLHDAGHD